MKQWMNPSCPGGWDWTPGRGSCHLSLGGHVTQRRWHQLWLHPPRGETVCRPTAGSGSCPSFSMVCLVGDTAMVLLLFSTHLHFSVFFLSFLFYSFLLFTLPHLPFLFVHLLLCLYFLPSFSCAFSSSYVRNACGKRSSCLLSLLSPRPPTLCSVRTFLKPHSQDHSPWDSWWLPFSSDLSV